MSVNFKQAVRESAQYALKKANNLDEFGGPDVHITAYVDGRTGFVQNMKEYGTRDGNSYRIGPATVTNGRNGYVLRLAGLEGTNIQNHKMKIELYTQFEDQMENRGWSMKLDLSQYAR